eukprot:9972894-Prorocentrum_lima.AAC.1
MTSSLVGSEDVYKRQVPFEGAQHTQLVKDFPSGTSFPWMLEEPRDCLLYTSDAADDSSV